MLQSIASTSTGSLHSQGLQRCSSRSTYVALCFLNAISLTCEQSLPADVKFSANSVVPQFTNNEDVTIEKGSQVRLKFMGLRSEVGNLFGIGEMKQDYLGYVFRRPGLIASCLLTIFTGF